MLVVVVRLVLVAVLALAGAARAASEELWRSAVEAEVDADHQRAATLWLEVLAQPDLDETARVAATFRLGVVELERGRAADARAHFAYVVERAPDFAVPVDTPASARALFADVRRGAGVPTTTAPATTKAPASTVLPTKTTRTSRPVITTPRALWIGAGAAGLVGAVALTAGVLFAVESATFEQEAVDARTLDERVRLNKLSDQGILYADVAFLTGAALVLVGTGAATAAWSMQE